MTPSPTQAAAPGLRLRTMARPADHLWIGPDVPPNVPLEIGTSELDLLDRRDGGGWIATYRERMGVCTSPRSCATTVSIIDAAGKTESVSLAPFYSRPERLEVQDVRVVDGVIYFNEACQSYAREAGGRCSALVALDVATKKVLWRTAPLVSNNEFRVVGAYIVTAYGFTGEPASVRIVRRKDGALVGRQPLPGTNFEMTRKGDTLSIEIYHRIGTVHFRLEGFDGGAPRLVALPTTPPDPTDKPKDYDPPLLRSGSPGPREAFGLH